MKRFLFATILFASGSLSGQTGLPPIGQWREHLPYNSAIDLAAGNGLVYCATPYSLFTVNISTKSVERRSKMTGLNETGIRAIAWDAQNEQLFIAYHNSNIDILRGNDIYNIPDVKRDNIIGDKSIYHIYPRAGDYYLSTGLGIIVIDGARYEVKDTWLIGNGGSQVKVNSIETDAAFFYAATQEGLKKAPVNSPDLADYANWQLVSGTDGLPAGACEQVLYAGGKIIARRDDSLWVQTGTQWQLFYADGWPMVNGNVSEGKILLCQRQASGISRVLILEPGGSVSRILDQSGAVSFPRKAMLISNNPWVADQFAGLSHFYAGLTYESFSINSPQERASGDMLVYHSVFYATAGAVNDAWNYQYNGDGIYRLRDGSWENTNRYRYPALDSMLDFITVAVDPLDESVWAGSFGGGLLHVQPGPVFEIFKQNTLGQTAGDPGSYRVAGLVFDRDRNLWVSNFGSAEPLRVRKADGSWRNFAPPFFLSENALAQLIIDDHNYKWIVSPLGNGLVCFDHGSDLDNTSDDRWRKLGGPGTGGLPNNEVLCVAKDKNGYIWAGTTDGVGVFQCPSEIFSATGCEAVWPVVPNGNFAGYLFKGQEVRSIAVDGADRKWVATKNGVFLISPDGTRLIYRFTEENSPLLSSDVRKIAIDGQTGEVYFATLRGLCSYRGTATEGGESNNHVLVFPNPVPPGFSGTIGIRGLPENAIVKITELDGRLVYQARALGGQAAWDGKNYKGQRVSSGVYLVLVSDDGRQEKITTKIFFIAK